jgi:uncharacterized protein
MTNVKESTLRNTCIALAITMGFLAATILLVGVPAGRLADAAAREYAAGIARVVIALFTILAIRRSKLGSDVLTRPAPRGWIIILPVAVYSLIVYPLLFTGSLRLNLSQPNLAVGVAFNGFAAGGLEELVFRGLILSILLGANADDPNRKNLWRAILISAFFFALPHGLNIFVGHVAARVVAQLVWSFLLGIVFACLRISGRSVWPVAVLHGVMNAFVHVNRLGVEIQPSLLRAVALALAPVPLCIYGAFLLRERRRITPT